MSVEVTEPQSPAFSVVAGSPTDEELAALAVVVSALRRERGRPHAPETMPIAGRWKSYWRGLREPMFPGVDAWRGSLR